MPISTNKKFIYFVVPKCGSSTVRSALENHCDLHRLPDFFSEHFTIDRFLRSKYAPLINGYFKFTFVRNPYDKLYSGFLQDWSAAHEQPRWIEAKKDIFSKIGFDFNRYIQDYVASCDRFNDWRWVCFTPMHAFTHHQGRYQLDWFGSTERLEADLRDLSVRLDLGIERIESKNVRTPARTGLKYLAQYDRKTVKLVNKLYRFDFRFFGYEILNPARFPRRVEPTEPKPLAS